MRADESTFTLRNQHASGIRAGDQEYLFRGFVLTGSSLFQQRLGNQGNTEVSPLRGLGRQ